MYVPLFLCVRVHVYVWVWVLKLAVKFSFVLCCCRTANRPIPAPITLPTFCLHSFAKSISKMCKTFSCNVDDVVVVVVGGSRIKSDSPQDILYLIYSVTAIYSSLARSSLCVCTAICDFIQHLIECILGFELAKTDAWFHISHTNFRALNLIAVCICSYSNSNY